MLLSSVQAAEIYSVMMALNNINGRVHVRIDMPDDRVLHVVEYKGRDIQVYIGDAVGNPLLKNVETFDHQRDFAEAYGLILR